jgi:hypothetical protein
MIFESTAVPCSTQLNCTFRVVDCVKDGDASPCAASPRKFQDADFDNSIAQCRMLGAGYSLVTPLDAPTMEAVSRQCNSTWLGTKWIRRGSACVMVDSDNETVEVSLSSSAFWRGGEPNNLPDNSDCSDGERCSALYCDDTVRNDFARGCDSRAHDRQCNPVSNSSPWRGVRCLVCGIATPKTTTTTTRLTTTTSTTRATSTASTRRNATTTISPNGATPRPTAIATTTTISMSTSASASVPSSISTSTSTAASSISSAISDLPSSVSVSAIAMASETATSVAVVPLDDGGLIAGIVVFVIVFVGLIAVLVVLFRRRAQQNKPEPGISLNSTTTTTTTSTTGDTLSNASMLTATEQIYGSSRFAQLE